MTKREQEFVQTVWAYYRVHKRGMPWRRTRNPYRIAVSEIMLQQTQVSRVAEKYPQFIAVFPDFSTLARASQRTVLAAWQGLGYNRRGLMVQKLAQQIMTEYGGTLPRSPERLITLPGIGKATAGSIAAFAFNIPVVFIETNIRRAYLHHFFPERHNVDDAQLRAYVERTLDRDNPREWYFALMDYGAMLGTTLRSKNPNRNSKHYMKQSAFGGSTRQLRGMILRALLQKPRRTVQELSNETKRPESSVLPILIKLEEEGMVRIGSEKVSLR